MSTTRAARPTPTVRAGDAGPRRPRVPWRRRVRAALWFVACVLVSVATVAPLLWTLVTSLREPGEILATRGLDLIPDHFTLDNYREALTSVPFGRYALNSMVIGVAGVVTNLFFGSLAGYAFAKLTFPGRRGLFGTLLASMMIPGIVTMVPLFLVLRHFPLAGGNDVLGDGGLGFINSFWAVILPGAAGTFAVFFMKQFFETLPDDLGEAARLDGAGEFRIFWQVYLPLVKAGLAVLAVLTFQAGWNNFMWPLIVLNSEDMMTVQVGLSSFVSNYNTSYGPLMAGTVIASLPVVVVFLIAQRWIVEGVAHVGGK